MESYDPNRSVGALLSDVARLARKRFDQRAKGLRLTRAQYYLLARLSRHEGINQVGLADLLEIEPITLARLVDRMEAGGWVERRLDPADRRARLLYLTAKSRPVIDQIRVIAAGVYDEALRGLDRSQRDQFVDALIVARRNLSEIAAAGDAAPMALSSAAD